MFLGKTIKDDNYKKIEIKYDERSASHYSFKIYNIHPFLKKFISKDKFQILIDTANNIIYDAKIEKGKFDNVTINNYTYIIIFLALIFIIIYFILFYYSPRINKNQSALFIFGLIFLGLAFIILLLLEIFNSLRKIEGEKTLFEFYKDDMITYINQLNETYKDKIVFNYNENNQNIICYIKIENKNSLNNSNNDSSYIDSDNDNDNDNDNNTNNNNSSSQVIERSSSQSNLNSKKTN